MALKIALGDLESANVAPAFGPDSLGLLIVSDLGPRYRELRRHVLESARRLAHLPREQLEALEVPEALYLTGWSHGREKLESGKPDMHKGSFYANCNFTRTGLDRPDDSTSQRFPSALNSHPNVWPTIQDFEANLKELVTFMVGVVVKVAAACDRTLNLDLEKSLAATLADSDVSRARLLHYYQNDENEEWCGNHRDHSCLTGLTSALWGPDTESEPKGPAGLYIESRAGQVVKAEIPEDCMAIQSGSALEAMTGGRFRAVPHRVVGDPRRYRSTLAVFCQPRLEDMVGEVTFAEFGERIVRGYVVE